MGRAGLQILNLKDKYITLYLTHHDQHCCTWERSETLTSYLFGTRLLYEWSVKTILQFPLAHEKEFEIINLVLDLRDYILFRLETPYPVFNALFYWREIHRSAWEDGKHTRYNKSEHRQSTANKSRDRQWKDRAKAISRRESVPSKRLSSSILLPLHIPSSQSCIGFSP